MMVDDYKIKLEVIKLAIMKHTGREISEEILNRFCKYLTMKHCFYYHKIKVKSDFINKLQNDLIDIHKQFKEIKKKEKELSLEELKEQYFIPIYKKANDMIKRYGDIYERIS